MWTYDQATGAIARDGRALGRGYAGRGEGKNNPAMQGVHMVGPLPRGRYTIGEPRRDPRLGPWSMPLTPAEENDMLGRSGFWIHPDSISHPGEASEGCICADSALRRLMWISGDHELEVT